jgi:uncharacterized protein (TIGR00369 family)
MSETNVGAAGKKPSLAEMISWRGSSGITEFIGHRMVDLQPGKAVVELDMGAHFCNRGGGVHGGIYCLLMDTVGGYAGVYTEDPNEIQSFITLSLTTNFLGQPKGGKMIATGRRRGGGRSTYFSDIEIHDELGHLLATGSGTFRTIPTTAVRD